MFWEHYAMWNYFFSWQFSDNSMILPADPLIQNQISQLPNIAQSIDFGQIALGFHVFPPLTAVWPPNGSLECFYASYASSKMFCEPCTM